MNLVTCTRRLECDAGHRLLRHEGKCRNYHGHRYVFEVTVQAPELDDVGRVVDFSFIKDKVGTWLDTHLDHGMVLQDGDPLIAALVAEGCKVHVVSFSPTSENLARYVYGVAVTMLPAPLRVVRVRCWETPNCFSDYEADR